MSIPSKVTHNLHLVCLVQVVSLNLPLGLSKHIARKDIKALRANSKSLMPDLLEKAMTPQELADLIAFIKR